MKYFGLLVCLAAAMFLQACVTIVKVPVTYPPGAPRIDSEYGSYIGVNGGRRNAPHFGIDIKGEYGQPVIAAADGVVLNAVAESCWGPTIAVDHGKDPDGKPVIALYGHVGDMLVKKGDRVRRGDVIAKLGNNHGDFTCIFGVRHLHFHVGRDYRARRSSTAWGYGYFLKDGNPGVNPHLLWADGKGLVTCFEKGQSYPPGTLTYPVPCRS